MDLDLIKISYKGQKLVGAQLHLLLWDIQDKFLDPTF